MEHGGINHVGVKEEYTEYLLTIFNLGWHKVAFLDHFSPLDLSTIVGSGTWMW